MTKQLFLTVEVYPHPCESFHTTIAIPADNWDEWEWQERADWVLERAQQETDFGIRHIRAIGRQPGQPWEISTDHWEKMSVEHLQLLKCLVSEEDLERLGIDSYVEFMDEDE